MLVKWNGLGLMGTPLVNANDKVQGGEKTIIFMPGWNEIPNEHWELLKNSFIDDIANKTIEIYTKPDKDAEGKPIQVGCPLRDVRADVARRMVEETFNIKTLKAWADDPKMDRDMRYYIEKQIDACRKGGTTEE